MATATMTCSKCQKTFDTPQGLNMHQIRAHSPSGKSWGAAKQKTRQKRTKIGSGSTREMLRSVLAENPGGLVIADLVTKMQEKGHKSADPKAYLAQLARNDSDIRKTPGRGGAYFLKAGALKRMPQIQIAEPVPAAPQLEDLTKEQLIARVEVLSVRCDQLLIRNRTLGDASSLLMRGLTHEV